MEDYVQKYKADDIGTRLQHMVELHELWNVAHEICTRPGLWHSPLEEMRAKELNSALTLLQHHMTAEYKEPKAEA